MIVVVSRGHRPSSIYEGIGKAQVAEFAGNVRGRSAVKTLIHRSRKQYTGLLREEVGRT
jgi:hypothetical protein